MYCLHGRTTRHALMIIRIKTCSYKFAMISRRHKKHDVINDTRKKTL